MTKLLEIRQERTNWRDKKLEKLLRSNGIWQPDSFLVTEYNYGKSVAIIDYQYGENKAIPDSRILSYTRLRSNQIYYFIVKFDYILNGCICRMSNFTIYPSNEVAYRDYGKQSFILNEKDFIVFLYKIRNNIKSPYMELALQNYKGEFLLTNNHSSPNQIISHRHRTYAYDVPAADIDSVLFNGNIPYLFIEYKARRNNDHNYFIEHNMDLDKFVLKEKAKKNLYNKAIADLGDGCKNPIPVIAVEYDLEKDIFTLYAFNDIAKDTVQLGSKNKDEYFKYICNHDNFHKKTHKICPVCGGKLILKKGIYGSFLGCENFSTYGCRYTEKNIA